MISSANFWIFPLAFAKNGLFFDLNRFFLENGPLYGSKTLIFRNYNQFPTKWYIICLYSMKIEASRFFSQKSCNCPMGRSSLFEPCLISSVSPTLRIFNAKNSRFLTYSCHFFSSKFETVPYL